MPSPTGVGAEELRRANLRAILQTVHTHGPTTRAVLTKQLGLNRSTIGALTGELQSLGPGHRADVGGGREVGPAVAPGRSERATTSWSRSTSGSTGSRWRWSAWAVTSWPAGLAATSAASTTSPTWSSRWRRWSRTCSRSRRRRPPASGIGVAVPGAVRARDGLVRFAPNLGWVDEPFTDLLVGPAGPARRDRQRRQPGRGRRAHARCRGRLHRGRLPQRQRRHRWWLPRRGSAADRRERVRRRGRPHAGRQRRPRPAAAVRSAAGRPRWGRTSCSSRPAGCRAADRRPSPR